MTKPDKPFLDLLKGRPHRLPIWMMRQAGRYLPEYRAIRSKKENFLDLCLSPEEAAEITMQPVRRFQLDAAIVFADILLVPHALGQTVTFKDNEGPFLDPVRDVSALNALMGSVDKLDPVFETLSRVKEALDPSVTLLGFAGGVWTVACYMVEGRGKQGFASIEEKLANDTSFLQKLTEKLMDTTLEYLGRQIEAGAEVVLLFDSWAGLLDGEAFQRWVVYPTEELVRALKAEYPSVPVLGFPRGASPDNYRAYVEQTGIDAMIVDPLIPLDYMRDALQPIKPLQGNLDPALLVQGGKAMEEGILSILQTLCTNGRPHIISTGHGLLPQTPPENVQAFVSFVRAWENAQFENSRPSDEFGRALLS